MDYGEIPPRMRVGLVLAFAIAISFCVVEYIVLSRGGSLAGTIHINNFTLCQGEKADGTPQPLPSLILKPTNIVHACGYLDVSLIWPSELCFTYEVMKKKESVFRRYDAYCVPWRSQYFSFPVTTTELLIPDMYKLYICSDIKLNSPASVDFEIRSIPK